MIKQTVLSLTLMLSAGTCLCVADAPTAIVEKPLPQEAQSALSVLAGAKRKAQADYDAAVQRATNTAVASLEKSKAAMMHANNLDFANAVASKIEQLKVGGAGVSTLTTNLVSTKWLYKDGPGQIIYTADGVVRGTEWKEGSSGRWAVIDDHTFEQQEPGGANIRVTFDSSFQVALWTYQNSDGVAYMRRAK